MVSFVLNWDLFLEYFSAAFGSLISSLFIVGLQIGAIFYFISLLFR